MTTSTSLFFRNLFFTVIQPGVVVGLIPYLLLGEEFSMQLRSPFSIIQYGGILIFLPGLVILLDCITRFATEGRGTLSPVDPTKKLVISGWYKYSRNPMYVGVTLMLLGEALFFLSYVLLIYLFLIFIAFSLFIKYHEEPRLRKDFGKEYEDYCNKVRRWL